MRIIQISDTHLSVRHKHFAGNNAAIARWLGTEKPDLVINTGDLSMDGARLFDDQAYAAGWHAALGVPVLSVPGNHDVGDLVAFAPTQPVNAERLTQWQGLFGPDMWVHDLPGWRLIGLNAMLMGTGLPEEAAQEAWLRAAVASDSLVGVFLHKPLFIDRPEEPARGYWTVPPAPRARVLAILAGCRLAFVSSGHLHIARRLQHDGVEHIWCPAASFVVGPFQEELGGARVPGVIEHIFTAAGVSSRTLRPDGLDDLLIDPVGKEIYG